MREVFFLLSSIDSFKRVEELVHVNNISFYALGKEVGFSSSFFSEWKRGKMMPKIDKLKKLADYFGVSIDYFLEEDKVPV